MSAIVKRNPNLFDDVRRYRTKCKIRFDSHNVPAGEGDAKPIWLSDAVIAVQTSKTLKGIGQASITLTPSNNWLNILFPDDYVNIYFDIGDGEGWTRTFFGFIDRVEETYQVGQDGKPQTRYHIVCSDFQKAFERTNIYFNPHMANRPDFQGADFATPNIGGLGLATKGIEVGGSPPDMVMNILLVTIGFGSQFVLPPSLDPKGQNRLRQRRFDYIQGTLSETAKQAIERAGGNFDAFKEQVRQEASGLAADTSGQYATSAERVAALAKASGLSVKDIEAAEQNDKLVEVLADKRIRELLAPSGQTKGRTAGSFSEGALNILEGTAAKANSFLLDVVDIFTFIERRAIDGFLSAAPIWQQQDSLMNLMRTFCNETVNELFFDLRPMSLDTLSDAANYGFAADDPAQQEYSRDEDEIGGNKASENGGNQGIMHIPALVMREYPFSTIEGLDLRDVNLALKTKDGQNEKVGIVFFGSIFSDQPNEPGRHIVTIPNINWVDRAKGGTSLSLNVPKHIDVAVIHETEVTSSQLGRSDADHFNLFEFFSTALIGQDSKYFMYDLLPIITPIQIQRHGLRKRTITTRFSSFELGVVERTSGVVDQNAVTTAKDTKESSPWSEVVSPGDIVPPTTYGSGARFATHYQPSNWGYRQKSGIGTPPGTWVMHQGIDVSALPNLQFSVAALQVPVQCIADGEVVISAPEGAYGGYGDIVVVKHKFEGVEKPVYSVYAHLSKRLAGWNLGDLAATKRAPYAAKDAPGVPFGIQEPIKIRKGEAIGLMGNTGISGGVTSYRKKGGSPTRPSGVHLHFELDHVFPPRNDSITPRIPISGHPSRPTPPSGYDRSLNPIDFYKDIHGLDLSELINSGSAIDPSEVDPNIEPATDDRADPVDAADENRPREDVLVENNAEPLPEVGFQEIIRGAVDSSMTRTQIIRWALLQDHWYQHNLEYLSGRINMRGAPEIRVGYRLDLKERNMSFYVEGVNHSWQFPDKMSTALSVTRGQPNYPFPLYVLPKIEPFNPTEMQRKTAKSRLATYFLTPDILAVRRSVFLNGNGFQSTQFNSSVKAAQGEDYLVNEVDNTEQDDNGTDSTYEEHVISASSREVESALEEESFKQQIDALVEGRTLSDDVPSLLQVPEFDESSLVPGKS